MAAVSWAGIGGNPGWIVMGVGASGFAGGIVGPAVLVLGSDIWEMDLEDGIWSPELLVRVSQCGTGTGLPARVPATIWSPVQ